jgi:hypothetical protein
MRHRRALVGGALVAALLIVIYPPWRAEAVRETRRYADMSGVAPLVLVDTVRWSLSFVPLYARPHVPFTATDIRHAIERASLGDITAKRTLVTTTDRFERRYGVPDVLRVSGSLWRDSVLAAAGVPSISVYDVSFAIDDRRLALRLFLVALMSIAVYAIQGRARPIRTAKGITRESGG